MALKVRESAKLTYYQRNLKLFGPSRAPLGPLGGKSDHPMALICRQNGLWGRPISFLSVQKRNLTAPTAILVGFERLEMVGFAPRGFQGRPGGLKNRQIIEGICELGGLRDLRGHFGPLACI